MAIYDDSALVTFTQDWLYDYIVQFLRSPGWRIPILSFIDDYCEIFEDEDENKFIYTDIHTEFKDMIDTLLENVCLELNITQELFVKACAMGLRNRAHRRVFEQIIACDNFLSFKKLMIKRNYELDAEAMANMQKEEGFDFSTPAGQHSSDGLNLSKQERAMQESYLLHQQNQRQREQSEIEHAVSVSLALEMERQRKMQEEEDEFERALRLSAMEHEAEMKRRQEMEQFEQKRLIEQQQQEAKRLEAERQRIEALRLQEEEKKRQMQEEQIRKQEEERIRQQEEERRRLEEERRRQADQSYRQKEDEIRAKLLEEQRRLDAERQEQQRRLQQMSMDEKRRREEEKRKFDELNAKRLASLSRVRGTETEDDAERRRRQAEEERKAYLQGLNQFGGNNQDGTIDVSAQRNEAEDLRRRADEIVKQNSARGGDAIEAESLAERQARLRRQRDMILAKKRAEREKEMQDYLNQGGVDLAMKRDSNENAEAVERRRQIAQKLRQELAN